MDPPNRIVPYLSPAVKLVRLSRRRTPLYFGPGTGLLLATAALVASSSLHYKNDELSKHGLAIFLMAIACASSAAGCVVGFGNHDNGCLPIRTQILGGIIGLIDLVMAFATIILFAAMLKP